MMYAFSPLNRLQRSLRSLTKRVKATYPFSQLSNSPREVLVFLRCNFRDI
jgi:hypothetical protein